MGVTPRQLRGALPAVGRNGWANIIVILIASAFYSDPDILAGIYIVIRHTYRRK